jgi:hypothetical protein
MNVTYWELAGLLAMTPILIYVAYWRGFNNGKREGYITGRNLLRVPVRNDR